MCVEGVEQVAGCWMVMGLPGQGLLAVPACLQHTLMPGAVQWYFSHQDGTGRNVKDSVCG